MEATLVSHEAQNTEDDESSKHTRPTIDERYHDGVSTRKDDVMMTTTTTTCMQVRSDVLVTVVVELVVASHRQQRSEAYSERIQDLHSRIAPHLTER